MEKFAWENVTVWALSATCVDYCQVEFEEAIKKKPKLDQADFDPKKLLPQFRATY
jgi:hypothetical protein